MIFVISNGIVTILIVRSFYHFFFPFFRVKLHSLIVSVSLSPFFFFLRLSFPLSVFLSLFILLHCLYWIDICDVYWKFVRADHTFSYFLLQMLNYRIIPRRFQHKHILCCFRICLNVGANSGYISTCHFGIV